MKEEDFFWKRQKWGQVEGKYYGWRIHDMLKEHRKDWNISK